MARYDDLNTNMIAFATVISVLTLIAILQGTQALCYNLMNAELEKKNTNSEYRSSLDVISEQRASINGYKKVAIPPAEGESAAPITRLQIPIDRAMELIATENAKASVAPGT